MTDYNLTVRDQVFLITGGARGIGFAIAQRAISAGASVAICDLSQSCVDEAVNRLGRNACGVVANVAVEADCIAAIEKTVEHFGAVHVLVNNAGIMEDIRSTKNQDLSAWRNVIDVNLQGSFTMAKHAAAAMQSHDTRNAIINLSSVTGLVGFRASNAYGVSKAAVAMLTKTLALDFASRGVRVNAVAPGFVDTTMARDVLDKGNEVASSIQQRIPMARLGRADEIASAVLFLASDLASYITGVTIPVDGGWCAFGGPSVG